MTPEERAKAIADDDDDRWGHFDIDGYEVINRSRLAEFIAAAIRQAENEALERAAREADRHWDSLDAAYPGIHIRALKHPD